jgi:hypothetical protein
MDGKQLFAWLAVIVVFAMLLNIMLGLTAYRDYKVEQQKLIKFQFENVQLENQKLRLEIERLKAGE